MRERDETPNLPPNPAPYLIEWLFEIGPTTGGGVTETALGYRDLAAWQSVTGIDLTPWEGATLRKMSQAYLGERLAATDPTRPAPLLINRVEARANVDDRIRSMFRNLQKA